MVLMLTQQTASEQVKKWTCLEHGKHNNIYYLRTRTCPYCLSFYVYYNTLSTVSFYPLFPFRCISISCSSLSLPSYYCTVCPVNEYVGGIPEACQPCPARSSSPGGVVRVCSCMDSTGRINELDPSLPCVGESLAGDMLRIFVLVESIHCIISVYYRLHDCKISDMQ